MREQYGMGCWQDLHNCVLLKALGLPSPPNWTWRVKLKQNTWLDTMIEYQISPGRSAQTRLSGAGDWSRQEHRCWCRSRWEHALASFLAHLESIDLFYQLHALTTFLARLSGSIGLFQLQRKTDGRQICSPSPIWCQPLTDKGDMKWKVKVRRGPKGKLDSEYIFEMVK